jgi:hypothetical protein
LTNKTISIYCSTSFILNNSNYTICKWIDSNDQTSYNDTYENAINDCPNGYQLASADEFMNEHILNSIHLRIVDCQKYVFLL